MMGKREKEANSIELEQPEGVPKVREREGRSIRKGKRDD